MSKEYVIKDGKALTTKRGCLGPGVVVTEKDFSNGQDAIDALLKSDKCPIELYVKKKEGPTAAEKKAAAEKAIAEKKAAAEKKVEDAMANLEKAEDSKKKNLIEKAKTELKLAEKELEQLEK